MILKGCRLAISAPFFCMLASLPSNTAHAQGTGDYDNDYDVDGSDFLNWEACMGGMGTDDVDPWSPCGAFDFDMDYDVDLSDFGAFQAAFQKPPNPTCTPPPGLRIWIGAKKTPLTSIGGEVIISHPNHGMKLCNETSPTDVAASIVHIAVTSSDLEYWMQIGYLRRRIEGWLQEGIYAETESQAASGVPMILQEYYNLCIQNPRPGHPEEVPSGEGIPPGALFTCQKEGLTSTKVLYDVNTLRFHSWENDELEHFVGGAIYLQGELYNIQDDLPGKSTPDTSRCLLRNFKYRPADPTIWISLNLAESDLRPLPSGPGLDDQWDRELLSPSILAIWDKNLNP